MLGCSGCCILYPLSEQQAGYASSPNTSLMSSIIHSLSVFNSFGSNCRTQKITYILYDAELQCMGHVFFAVQHFLQCKEQLQYCQCLDQSAFAIINWLV